MVEIKKIGKDKIEIDGIGISIKDYNKRDGWYKDDEYALKKEYQELAEGIFIGESKRKPGTDGSKADDYYSPEEYLKEMEKTKKVNWNYYHEAEKIYNEITEVKKKAFWRIFSESVGDSKSDNETKIKESVEHNNIEIGELAGLYKKKYCLNWDNFWLKKKKLVMMIMVKIIMTLIKIKAGKS